MDKSFENSLVRIVRVLDRATDAIGRIVSWIFLGMVLLTFAIVIGRYVFDAGRSLFQDGVQYMHGLAMMLGAGYAYFYDAHVRVDVFHRGFDLRRRALIEIVGCVAILLPLTIIFLVYSFPYFLDSVAIGEESPNPDGLPALYVAKAGLVLMPVVLLVQGIARTLRGVIVLRAPEAIALSYREEGVEDARS